MAKKKEEKEENKGEQPLVNYRTTEELKDAVSAFLTRVEYKESFTPQEMANTVASAYVQGAIDERTAINNRLNEIIKENNIVGAALMMQTKFFKERIQA